MSTSLAHKASDFQAMYAAQAGKMAADCAEGQLRLLNTLMKI
jgi:hypothetical protein